MKKTGKILLVVSLCCVIFGTTLCCAATVLARTTGERYNDAYTPRLESRAIDELASVSLNLLNEPVTVQYGKNASVEWWQSYDNQYSVSFSNQEHLTFERVEGIGWFWNRGSLRFDISALESWIRRWGWYGEGEIGEGLPVVITVPEGTELRRIEINGVDVQVLLDNVAAQTTDINGVNTRVTLNVQDISDYSLEANAISSSLRIDGMTLESVVIGSNLYYNSAASRHVTVNGVNAELDVWTR